MTQMIGIQMTNSSSENSCKDHNMPVNCDDNDNILNHPLNVYQETQNVTLHETGSSFHHKGGTNAQESQTPWLQEKLSDIYERFVLLEKLVSENR